MEKSGSSFGARPSAARFTSTPRLLWRGVGGGAAVAFSLPTGGAAFCFPPLFLEVLLFPFFFLLGSWWGNPNFIHQGEGRPTPKTKKEGEGGVAVFPLLLRGAAFRPLLWVGLRSSLLLGGAAWSPPPFWLVLLFSPSFCVVLPSFTSFGWGFFSLSFKYIFSRGLSKRSACGERI